jgi:hypothetical protein
MLINGALDDSMAGSSGEKTYSDMILHHAVVWTTLVVGAVGVAAAENSTALIRRSMQEEIDSSTCDKVVATIGELRNETAIRAALQDTVIATEQQRTTFLSDGDHRSFACTAWLGMVRLAAAQAVHTSVCHDKSATAGSGSS